MTKEPVTLKKKKKARFERAARLLAEGYISYDKIGEIVGVVGEEIAKDKDFLIEYLHVDGQPYIKIRIERDLATILLIHQFKEDKKVLRALFHATVNPKDTVWPDVSLIEVKIKQALYESKDFSQIKKEYLERG